MQYTVTKTRKELSADGSHRHVEGVCTTAGVHYTRREVVASINAGNLWVTSAGGSTAVIKPISYCPRQWLLRYPLNHDRTGSHDD